MAWSAVGILVYSALAFAILAPTALIEGVAERLPFPLFVILITVVGPAALFAVGIGAWPVVGVALGLIAIFLGLARLAWSKSPGTEWFAFWLLCAVLVWAGSPWLLVVAGI
jgi:hypothetical protein